MFFKKIKIRNSLYSTFLKVYRKSQVANIVVIIEVYKLNLNTNM